MLGFGAALSSFAAGLVGVAIMYLGLVIFRLTVRAEDRAHTGDDRR
jgi:hypothetical protein